MVTLPTPPKGYKLVPPGTPGPKHRRTKYWSGGGWASPSLDGSGYYDNCSYAVPVRVLLPWETAPAPKAPRKAPKLPETSLEAKESQKDKAPVDREIIMGHMKKHPRGTTCDRLEVLLGMSHQTASARINDLARAGRIVDSGRREKTRTGRNAICWKVVV